MPCIRAQSPSIAIPFSPSLGSGAARMAYYSSVLSPIETAQLRIERFVSTLRTLKAAMQLSAGERGFHDCDNFR